MAQSTHKLQRAVLALCWLGAGTACTSDSEKPESSSKPEVTSTTKARTLCTTFAMAKGDSASVKVTRSNVQLRVPATLEVQGKMSGGVAYLDFDRPKYGNLACRYEQGESSALELTDCGSEATSGDLVSANRMTLRMGSTAGIGRDVTITACADEVPAVGPMPADEPVVDFASVRPQEEGTPIESEPVKFGMTGELQDEYRATAEKDPAIKKLLGERFAYSYLETIDPPKGQEPDSIHVKLWFYSHTNSMSVWVEMRNGAVEKFDESELLVPEAKSEVEASVALARKDPALVGKVNDLEGNAMLAVVPEGAKWAGNRVLDVRFYDAGFTSHYMALVDLTTERVLEAGPVE